MAYSLCMPYSLFDIIRQWNTILYCELCVKMVKYACVNVPIIWGDGIRVVGKPGKENFTLAFYICIYSEVI